jgi:hypothetical protein
MTIPPIQFLINTYNMTRNIRRNWIEVTENIIRLYSNTVNLTPKYLRALACFASNNGGRGGFDKIRKFLKKLSKY